MTEEEFAEIIKPLSLLDNPKHREFIRQVLTGNFNRWQESKVKNLSSNAVLADSSNCCEECSKKLESGTVFCSADCRRHYYSN